MHADLRQSHVVDMATEPPGDLLRPDRLTGRPCEHVVTTPSGAHKQSLLSLSPPPRHDVFRDRPPIPVRCRRRTRRSTVGSHVPVRYWPSVDRDGVTRVPPRRLGDRVADRRARRLLCREPAATHLAPTTIDCRHVEHEPPAAPRPLHTSSHDRSPIPTSRPAARAFMIRLAAPERESPPPHASITASVTGRPSIQAAR